MQLKITTQFHMSVYMYSSLVHVQSVHLYIQSYSQTLRLEEYIFRRGGDTETADKMQPLKDIMSMELRPLT